MQTNTKNNKTLEQIERTYNIPKSSIITISALNHYLTDKLCEDPALHNTYIIGEVSNMYKSQHKHIYFTLKEKMQSDEIASIRCVVFNKTILKYQPKDGEEILIKGNIQLYKKEATCQIDVREIYPIGKGLISIQLQQLKQKLQKEGLFDLKHKRPIPEIPTTIAIVGALKGKGTTDIVKAIQTRNPNVPIIIIPTTIQGPLAPKSIINSIELANEYNTKYNDLSTIICGRGGGSYEDLQPFNDENVIRAIYHSHVPILTAIGHRLDHLLSDDASDLSEPTPTSAGIRATLDCNTEISKLNDLGLQAKNKLEKIEDIHRKRQELKEQKQIAEQERIRAQRARKRAKMYKIIIAILLLIIMIIITTIII